MINLRCYGKNKNSTDDSRIALCYLVYRPLGRGILVRFINRIVDWFNTQIEDLSIKRWHIFAMFYVFGMYLVVLPMLHVIRVSNEIELEIGNYTNIISAGVSLLTLAEAKRIRSEAKDHHAELTTKKAPDRSTLPKFDH